MNEKTQEPAAAQDQGAAPAEVVKTSSFKSLDPTNLYRIDTYTDHAVGDIRVGEPVTVSGTPRAAPLRFFSSMVVNVNGQANTLSFEIPADSLAAAIAAMPAAAEAAGREYLKKLQEMRAKRPLIMPSGLPS